MKYAVIAISGKQIKVEENQKLSVDNLNLEEGKTNTIDQVLLTANEDKIKVGTPTVKGAQVEYKVLKNFKGKKLTVFKYKSKSRYRKTTGFRPHLTDIQITKITF
jgi:large subunit ribosomal protein L21